MTDPRPYRRRQGTPGRHRKPDGPTLRQRGSALLDRMSGAVQDVFGVPRPDTVTATTDLPTPDPTPDVPPDGGKGR